MANDMMVGFCIDARGKGRFVSRRETVSDDFWFDPLMRGKQAVISKVLYTVVGYLVKQPTVLVLRRNDTQACEAWPREIVQPFVQG